MKHTFAQDTTWFVKEMCSRKRMLPTFTHISFDLSERSSKDLGKFGELHGLDKVFDEEGKLTQFSIKPDFLERYRYLKQQYDDFSIFAMALPKMSLVSIVSLYDAFLAKLLRNLFKVKPELLNSCGRALTFSQLCKFDSLDAARAHVVEQEIESLLRDSHTEQIDWIESRLNIELKKLPAWKCFVEVTERRNLLVHADGIVSQQYLDVCKKAGCSVDGAVLGQKLHVPKKYYDDACTFMTEIGVKLSQVIWRKLCPDELEDCDIAFNNVGFDLLVEKEYRLAEQILALSDVAAFKRSNEQYQLFSLINRSIALRGQDEIEKSKALINTRDWSALSLKFRLAHHTLLEEYEAAAHIMRRLGASDQEVNKPEYKVWPLFRWFRKTELFKETYEEIYGEAFVIVEKKLPADEVEDAEVEEVEEVEKGGCEAKEPELPTEEENGTLLADGDSDVSEDGDKLDSNSKLTTA